MTARLVDRVSRLEQAAAHWNGRDALISPAVFRVLMYGVAVHVGGYPAPVGQSGMYLKDSVGDAMARGLGYADGQDARAKIGDASDWNARLHGAVDTLFERLGLSRAAGQSEVFPALVRMLDEFAAAKSTWGDARNWTFLNEDLDNWIRQLGLSPEAVRSKARQ